mgnify:CR=1 FL=1
MTCSSVASSAFSMATSIRSRWMAILLSGDGEPYATDEKAEAKPKPKRGRVNPPQSKAD